MLREFLCRVSLGQGAEGVLKEKRTGSVGTHSLYVTEILMTNINGDVISVIPKRSDAGANFPSPCLKGDD